MDETSGEVSYMETMNILYYMDGREDGTPIDKESYIKWRVGSGPTVEIYDLHVSNGNRRKGRGKWLVYTLMDRCLPEGVRMIWAITRASNRVAQEFYLSLKFKIVNPLFDFYGTKDEEGKDTIDAVMYGRELPKPQPVVK